jgi:hypothetical protein
MLRFTLKDVLVGSAITSVGLGMIAFALHWRLPPLSNWEVVQMLLAVGGASTTATGITYPFPKQSRTRLKSAVSFLLFAAVFVAVVRAIQLQKQIH